MNINSWMTRHKAVFCLGGALLVAIVVFSIVYGGLDHATSADTGENNPISTAGSEVSGAPIIIYNNDFEGVVGSEWSHSSTDITPVGDRRFLGQFGNDTVSLSLLDLPAHDSVHVTFELFVILSWDGNHIDFGPDIWDLTVGNGPTLLHTTFSNIDVTPGPFPQAYPDGFPGSDNPPHTGASEIDTLGYTFGGTHHGDSVYELSFSFPHAESSITLDFSASGLAGGLSDESWGLDNVTVSLIGVPPPPCTLFLDLAHTPDGISLDFTLGTSEPATWNLWAVVQSNVFRILNLQLPVIDPPMNPSFNIPVSNLGTIGFLTTLTTPGQGITCSDWETVNTGPPLLDSASSNELRKIFSSLE